MNVLTTIGVKVSFATESTPGERPTSGYKWVPGFMSTPDFGGAPDQIETTTFDNKRYKTYKAGLIDLGGALGFGARLSPEFYKKYNEVYEAAKTAYEAEPSKATWVCVDIPGWDKSYYIPVELQPIGFPGMELNSSVDITVYMSPIGEPLVENDPTYEE